MFTYLRGKITHFNRERGFGFITPDIKRGQNIFFNIKYFSGIREECPGELGLEFGEITTESEYNTPKYGDRVVYVEMYSPKPELKGKLMALLWTYEESWNKAQTVIKQRSEPTNCQVRIMRSGTTKNGYRPEKLWQGDYKQYLAKLNAGLPEADNEDIYLEELLATGWTRAWRPPG
jgi:hypothetical protein